MSIWILLSLYPRRIDARERDGGISHVVLHAPCHRCILFHMHPQSIIEYSYTVFCLPACLSVCLSVSRSDPESRPELPFATPLFNNSDDPDPTTSSTQCSTSMPFRLFQNAREQRINEHCMRICMQQKTHACERGRRLNDSMIASATLRHSASLDGKKLGDLLVRKEQNGRVGHNAQKMREEPTIHAPHALLHPHAAHAVQSR